MSRYRGWRWLRPARRRRPQLKHISLPVETAMATLTLCRVCMEHAEVLGDHPQALQVINLTDVWQMVGGFVEEEPAEHDCGGVLIGNCSVCLHWLENDARQVGPHGCQGCGEAGDGDHWFYGVYIDDDQDRKAWAELEELLLMLHADVAINPPGDA